MTNEEIEVLIETLDIDKDMKFFFHYLIKNKHYKQLFLFTRYGFDFFIFNEILEQFSFYEDSKKEEYKKFYEVYFYSK